MKSSINKFVVVLDEPNRVFSPGHHVQGKVILDVKQELKLSKVNLECRGEVYVSWPENSGTYTRYRYGREELFHVKACMHGADNEDISKSKKPSQSVLKPSVYSFSFRFTIPCGVLPPSYEAKHGYVRYWMQANIEKKKGASELKSSQAVFAVGGYEEYDDEELAELNDYVKYPNARETKTSTGGLCYPAGESIKLSARTNRLIYHPGEVIKASVTTDNEAHRAGNMRGIEASLVRLTVYDDGKKNTTNSKQEVVRAEKEVEDAREEDLELVLPSTTLYPTMARGSKNIKLTYYVKIRVKMNRKFQREPMLMIPVAIIPPRAQPSPRPPTHAHSHSDFHKDNYHSNSVSTITPGTFFYVTGSRQHRSRRAARETTSNKDTSGEFCFKHRPSISFV